MAIDNALKKCLGLELYGNYRTEWASMTLATRKRIEDRFQELARLSPNQLLEMFRADVKRARTDEVAANLQGLRGRR